MGENEVLVAYKLNPPRFSSVELEVPDLFVGN